jgi:hypothetical protein
MARGACAKPVVCGSDGITMAAGGSGAIAKLVRRREHGRHHSRITRSARTGLRDSSSGESLSLMTVRGSPLCQGRGPGPRPGDVCGSRTTRGVPQQSADAMRRAPRVRRGTSHRRCDRSAGDSGPVATDVKGWSDPGTLGTGRPGSPIGSRSGSQSVTVGTRCPGARPRAPGGGIRLCQVCRISCELPGTSPTMLMRGCSTGRGTTAGTAAPTGPRRARPGTPEGHSE